MKKILTLNKISWVHLVSPSKKEINELVANYDLHEIIEDDLRELHTQDKIDVYDDLIFLILHFPKFQKQNHKHYSNDFKIILGKNMLISISKHKTKTIEKIRAEYLEDIKKVEEEDKELVISPYYILYRILDELYDKTLAGLRKFNTDLNHIQDEIFEWNIMQKTLLNDLLIKWRNAAFLRNIMEPQNEIIEELNKSTIKLHKWDLDVYFEDLEYKVDKIVNQITTLSEHTESLSNKYNTLVTLKTNSIMSVLTIVTVIVGLLTLITWFYWMNIRLPWQDLWSIGLIISSIMVFLVLLLLFIFRKKNLL